MKAIVTVLVMVMVIETMTMTMLLCITMMVDHGELMRMMKKMMLQMLQQLIKKLMLMITGGSDESLMLKVRTIVASKHEKLTVPKRSSLAFVISHYAGQVCYNGTSFVDKNRDAVGRDVLDFFSRCHFRFFRLLFHEIADVHGGGKQPVADCSRGTSKSLVAKFRKQLTSLEGIMGSTQTHFIRCINSNEKKLPDTFDDVFVLKQIRATGILQAAK